MPLLASPQFTQIRQKVVFYMSTPFRRFLAAMSLACPSMALAQPAAPTVPMEFPKVTKVVQATPPAAPPLAPAPVPAAPSAAVVAASAPTEPVPEYKLVADKFWIG